jgi:shikimate dehydrogenase
MLSLGLIGYPLLHSLSPSLHSAALHSLKLEGEYRLYPVPPLPEGAPQLEAIFQRLRSGGIDGLNVTIPHKQNVLPLLDGLSDTAKAIGAVNTVFHQDGRLIGDNTDAPGFLADLSRLLPAAHFPRRALVLGAGGAARAIVYALLGAGWEVTVAARRLEQARILVDDLGGSAEAARLQADSLHRLAPDAGLIVNASSAGMLPDAQSSPWPDDLPLPKQAFVYDLVYKPLETVFLRRARVAGLPAANGLGMLVEQAALALERWSGRTAPRHAMWQAISS